MTPTDSSSLLINRGRERDALHALLEVGRPQLGLLTGRRRVGKTYLLTHVWGAYPYFLFTAARTTPEVNRRQLILDLAAWSGEDLHAEDYPTWRAVFNLLLDFQVPAPLVVVLDEFQYLAHDKEGLARVSSELNAAWERRRPPRSFLLVLCGSSVGTMESLAAGGGPLYGRFNWQHRLGPFGYLHAAEMVPCSDLRDRALIYGIFGGTPRYLAAVNPVHALAANVTRLMLDPTGEVRLLIETALDQEEGLRETSKYRAILRAVADGRGVRNEIAQRTGLSNDAGLRDKLARLEGLGYIEACRNFDARKNEPIRYGIADPAFRFHQRFVEPSLSMLARYPPDYVWAQWVGPQLDVYMGRAFERMAVEAYDVRAAALGLPLVARWGRWEGIDRNRRSLEVDLVARRADGRMLTGAVKWNRKPIGAGVHRLHLEMLHRAADAGRKWAHQALELGASLYYVAAGGFEKAFLEEVQSSGYQVTCWTLKDLYDRVSTPTADNRALRT